MKLVKNVYKNNNYLFNNKILALKFLKLRIPKEILFRTLILLLNPSVAPLE